MTAHILHDYSPASGYSTWLLVRCAWRQHVSRERAEAAYREQFGHAPMAVTQRAGGWWCGPIKYSYSLGGSNVWTAESN